MMRRVVVLASLLFLAGCGGVPPRPERGTERPSTVRVVMNRDPPSMSLLGGKSDQNSEILAVQITDSLVQYDERLEIQPRVAQSWEMSDDGLTLTFHLRPGVRWHDGRPVTAADVVRSVELVRDPAVENRTFGSLFQDVASVEALDEHTVRARYTGVVIDALEAWRVPLVPAHLVRPGVDLLTSAFAAHPVGCGPFRFVSYRPGQEIVLEANDDYWDGRPVIDRLVFPIYPDQRTGVQALLRGDVDLMVVTSDEWSEVHDSAAAFGLSGFIYSRLNVWQMYWNQDGSNPFFGDPRVRRAMILALDRAQFIDTVVHGLARPAVTSYHPDLKAWTDPDLRPLPYDPVEARRLLAEAGWVDRDKDGVRERDERPFDFTLMIQASTQALTDQLAAWVQQGWREIGVRGRIEKLEMAAFRERRDAHRFEAQMAGVTFTPSPDQFELYHSSAVASGFNHVSFSDPEVDRLLEQGRAMHDPAARREIYFRLQRRLQELQPLGWLMHFSTPVLHDSRLRGIVPTPLDHLRTSAGPRLWHWAAADDPN